MDNYDLFNIIVLTSFCLLLGLTFVLGFISYHNSNEACSDFGGKYNGESCVKNGYAYDVQNKDMWGIEKQIVKPVVSMETDK